MKKGLLLLISIILMGFNINSQTIVSTTPENMNVILEEFTGIHCVYCPQGHVIAQGIQDNSPEDVFLINIHTGSFATPNSGEPDFRTPFGSSIADQSGLTGYPSGTVNRHVFPGWENTPGGTAMYRNYWSDASGPILTQSSYVNVAVEAEIDVSTRELTIHVEAYYTGDSPENTNLLNVALLQDNTLGPQVGGNAGNEYNHMHRLVHMITDQWGEEVLSTNTGSFVDRTYIYTIPANYNNVQAELADLKIVAFISETQQEIISGNGCLPLYVGYTYSNDASVENIIAPKNLCSPITPVIEVRNHGSNSITSLEINYNINGGDNQIVSWTGTIEPLKKEKIYLDNIIYIPAGTNTITVSVNSDENSSNNANSINFDDAPEGTNIINMVLLTDAYGSECSWNVKNSTGTILYSGGPYGNNQTIKEQFYLGIGCYIFNIYDSYGDGGKTITIDDSEGTNIYYTNGGYGAGESQSFITATTVLPNIAFSPTDGETNIIISSDLIVTFNQPMRKLDDTNITNENISDFITLTNPEKGDIAHTAVINEEKTEITLSPDENLPLLTDITVSILNNTIESYFDDVLEFNTATFTTEEVSNINNISPNINIYPNPANNIVYVSNAQNTTITITDLHGKSVVKQVIISDTAEINIVDLSSGIYIVKIEQGNRSFKRKLNIIK